MGGSRIGAGSIGRLSVFVVLLLAGAGMAARAEEALRIGLRSSCRGATSRSARRSRRASRPRSRPGRRCVATRSRAGRSRW
ncbi:MAG: hypothetical protein WDO24_08450 [Pseudomonadota bacterium]